MFTALISLRVNQCYFVFCPFSSLDGRLVFNTLNLNSQASQFVDKPEGKELPVLCVQQLEKDTIFVGLDRILSLYFSYVGILIPETTNLIRTLLLSNVLINYPILLVQSSGS